MGSRGQTATGPAKKMEGERAGHLQAGASNATTPSGGNLPQRPSSATPLSAPPGSITGRSTPSFPNPVTRTPSACFPVTRVPSAQGLAMIRPNLHESTPPPTNMTWDEALAILHKLEKQLTLNVQTDLEKLRYRMTHSKIDLVARKSLRLYQMRVLLNTTRRLCREEEDIMADFGGVKAVIDSDPRGQIDEDDFMSTKSRLLTLGGRLTDNRRKQQRLASQVEELQGATKELVDTDQLTELNGYEFNVESFKRESSALPEMPRLAPSLPSYNLFNHAPYSPDSSRPGSAMSMDGERPGSAAVESTDEEEVASDAYLPQKHGLKKRKDLTRNKRAPSETASETSDGEEVYQVFTNPNNRMTTMEAKQKAEEDRKKAADEEAKLQKRMDFNIPNLIDEQLKREEEEEKRQMQKEEDEKKKTIPESKPKPAKIESKKKEPEEKKVLDIKTQAQARQAEEQEKKKSATEAKQKIEAEQHKKEVEAKKQADLDAKKKEKEENESRRKAELDAKQKEKEEAEAKKKADLEAKKKEGGN